MVEVMNELAQKAVEVDHAAQILSIFSILSFFFYVYPSFHNETG